MTIRHNVFCRPGRSRAVFLVLPLPCRAFALFPGTLVAEAMLP
jgi:hypothetical protein